MSSIQWLSAVFIGKIADEVDVGSQVCHQSSMSSTSSVVYHEQCILCGFRLNFADAIHVL